MLMWSLCTVLVMLWTGLAALLAHATRWVASELATGRIKDVASGAAQWPRPDGLPAWIDPQWIDMAQSAVVTALRSLADLSPQLSSMMSWMVPLVWVVWGLGLIFMLGLGGGAHWLIGRWQRSTPAV